MINRNLKSAFVLVCFSLVVLLTSNCTQIYQTGFVPIPNQPISGPIEIGSEWIEIVPPIPLHSYTSTAIYLRGFEYDISNTRLNSLEPILILKDGRKTKIEAILLDDRGESYELSIAELGNGVGFGRKPYEKSENGKTSLMPLAFPHDRNFTKLKIRSEIPIQCSIIELVQSVPF